MKKFLLSLAFFYLGSVACSQVTWAFAINGWSNTFAKKISVDGQGNKIVTGEYDYNSSDFDPSTNTYNLAISGWSGTDVFLAKYNVSNYLLWAIDLGGEYTDQVHGLVTDSLGNIYICGSFVSEILFTPVDTPYAHFYASNNGTHGFVAKYDKDGNFKRALIIDGGESYCQSIALDPLNNIYVTGKFSTTADFNPDTSATANLTANGGSDIFIAKYDSLFNYGWSFHAGSNDGYYGYTYNEGAHDILSDAGFLYIAGGFTGYNTEFNPGAGVSCKLSSNGQLDPFIAKYDMLGNFQWAKAITASGSSESAYDIDLDNSGNLYVTGTVYYSADFDPSQDTAFITTNGGNDVFVSKYDMNGNYIRAITVGGVNFDETGLGIDVNNSGEVFITGTYHGPSDFDPSSNNVSIGSSVKYGQIYIAGYDTAFNFRWAGDIGLDGYAPYNKDIGFCVHAKDDGTFYVCGSFSDDADFDPSAGTYLVQSNGTTNAFLACYNGHNFSWVGMEDGKDSEDAIVLYPNPASDFFRIESKLKIKSVHITDMNAKAKYLYETENKSSLLVETQSLPPGVYTVKVIVEGEKVLRRKLVVQ